MELLNQGTTREEYLKDITNIKIDHNKPSAERIKSYISAVGNPYLFKVGDIVVKINFNPKGKSLNEAVADMLTAC